MSDYINTIISIALAFVLTVGSVLVFSNAAEYNTAKVMILNETNNFLDKVTDAKEFSTEDIDDLSLAVNSYGVACNVNVKRLVPITQLTPLDDINVLYISQPLEDFNQLNASEVIKVSVEEIGISPLRNTIYKFSGIENRKIEFSVPAVVR